MSFQWDPVKDAANEAKHGISFVQAAQIFRGPVLRFLDDRNDYGEQRFLVLGSYDGVVLAVVITERDGDIRLISARRLTCMSASDTEMPKMVRYGSVDDLPQAPPLSTAVKTMTDEEADRCASSDPDAMPPSAEFWKTARIVEPEGTQLISLRLPHRVVSHFKATGKGYQSRIIAVLSSYVDASKKVG